MSTMTFLQYQVVLSRDPETDRVIAQIPALEIGDYGADTEEALRRLQEMASFHLKCLVAEGKAIPKQKAGGEGLYLRVRAPARAA